MKLIQSMRARLWVVAAAIIALALCQPIIANAQSFPSLFGDKPADTDKKADSDQTLIKSLEKSVGDGAEIIIIRPKGATKESAEAKTTPVSSADGPSGVGSIDDYRRLGAAGEAKMVVMAQSELADLYDKIKSQIARTPELYQLTLAQMASKSPTKKAGYFFDVVIETIVYLAISMLLVILVFGVLLIRPWFIRQKIPNPETIDEKLPILLLRAALGMVGIILAVVLALIFGLIFGQNPQDPATQTTLLVVFGAFVAIRLTAIGWRVILAPYLPEYRIPQLTNGEARRLFVWLLGTGALALAFQAYCVWLAALDLPHGFHSVVSSGLTLIIVLLNIAFVLLNNRTVGKAIRGGKSSLEATWPARWAAALWGPVVIIYSLAAWVVMTAQLVKGAGGGVPLIVGVYAIMLTAFAVYGLSSLIISQFFNSRARRRARLAALEAQARGESEPAALIGDATDAEGAAQLEQLPMPGGMRTAKDLGRRVATILAIGAGLYAFFHIWRSESATSKLTPWMDTVVDISVVILFGYIAYHALRIWIDQRIEEEGGGAEESSEPGEGEGGAGQSRLATLLPLFRNFVLTTITVTVLLIIALELGVNVGPLFAGAGIIGLALGFGAQALVRDILSGAFFLIDDAFRKGEYVDIGSVKGTVERISVRSFQLRHHLGYLHTVPFGEIQHLTNYSRDWVVMKLPIRLTYDTDVEAVRKKVKALGQELLQHPIHGPKFLQPLKSQGLIQMEDSAMIMRVKFMTKPGDQWILRKVILASIRELFEKEGIRFAHREVTVRLAGDDTAKDSKPLTDAAKLAAAGATSSTLLPHQQDEITRDDDGPGS
ncbi:MAG: mechanosensitive ion channel family protein [Neomegalonema sp.]|nr:mechanosensitive ion channel family protein [Neomegalonema sp.]